MFKLSIVLIGFLTICESFENGFYRHKKTDRSGYGYDPMSAYESMGYDSYGADLLSEYMPEYGMESYGKGGGGYGGYGGHGGHGGYGGHGYGGGMSGYSVGGYGGGEYGHDEGYGGAYDSMYGSKGMPYMPAPKSSYKPPIYMKKSIELKPMYGKGYGKSYNIKVPHGESPVKVMFLTQNTPVHVQQRHKKGQPEYKKATTHEEPHVLVHEVIKPVIQEIHEIIVPYRKVVQKIEPVKEEVKTIVHKKDGEEDDKYEDNDKKYRKYKYEKKDDDNDNDGYKKYKHYGSRDDDDDDSYKRHSRYHHDHHHDHRHHDYSDDHKSYKKYDDKYDRKGDSGDNLGVLASLADLASSAGTMNNGMTLAQIYGRGSEDQKKSS